MTSTQQAIEVRYDKAANHTRMDGDRRVASGDKKPRGYKDLLVWQKGMDLAKELYKATQTFPVEERFGLISQMRRAAVSIPSNIAEGQTRRTTKEFIQFISHAEGSVAELETQLMLAQDLRYCVKVSPDKAFALLSELRKMLNSLRRKLDRDKT